MDIVQFLMDMIWFGDITLSFLFLSILVGVVLLVLVIVIPISSGMLEYKTKPINTTKPNHRAIVFGKISAEEPFLWNDTSCAYFYNEKEGTQYPLNGKLCVTDDTGEREILLKDAEILGKTREIDGTAVQYIEQGSEYFVRGILNDNAQFETTYIASFLKLSETEKDEPIVSRPVDIQPHSILHNVRNDVLYFLGMALLITLVFEAYPLYSYYSYWDSEITDVVERRHQFRLQRSIRLKETADSYDVTSSEYEVCLPNVKFIKPAKSLSFGCGDNPETMYLRNMPLWKQVLNNWKILLFSIIIFAIILSPKTEHQTEKKAKDS